MSRQWLTVLLVVGGLALGAAALVKFTPGSGRAEIGAEAPDFGAIDIATGDSVHFRERYRDAVTLVNVWATWCVPCRTEMPAMQEVYAALKDKGFRIAAVSIDEGGPESVAAFAREMGLTFDILQDATGAIQQRYQTTGVPESFLVDRQGVIVKRLIGAHDWNSEANRKLIERYLTGG